MPQRTRITHISSSMIQNRIMIKRGRSLVRYDDGLQNVLKRVYGPLWDEEVLELS